MHAATRAVPRSLAAGVANGQRYRIPLVETGSEATTVRQLIQNAGGTWRGLSVMRDGLADGPARRGITPILSLYRPSSPI